MKKKNSNISHIRELVDKFYAEIRKDELLAPIFNEIIQDNWDKHLEKMYAFWQTILLKEHTYYGSPFLPHAKLPISKKHFDRWLKLFQETLERNFEGEAAEEALWRARKMAEMFQLKIDFHQKKNSKPLL
jgi:hemoglobin